MSACNEVFVGVRGDTNLVSVCEVLEQRACRAPNQGERVGEGSVQLFEARLCSLADHVSD